jgi:hypothetical protein
MLVVISDFYEPPENVVRTIEPMRIHGNDVVLFHVLDPQEMRPATGDGALLDMETGEILDVSREYAETEYRTRIDAHIAGLREKARSAGMDCILLDTSKPLDAGLREYLLIRQGRM